MGGTNPIQAGEREIHFFSNVTCRKIGPARSLGGLQMGR
jgi:hypothetical protein